MLRQIGLSLLISSAFSAAIAGSVHGQVNLVANDAKSGSDATDVYPGLPPAPPQPDQKQAHRGSGRKDKPEVEPRTALSIPRRDPRFPNPGGSLASNRGVVVSDPSQCPAGTNVILPNSDGTFTCFTISEVRFASFDPVPNDPPRRTGGTGTRFQISERCPVRPAPGCFCNGPVISCQDSVAAMYSAPALPLYLGQIEPPPESPAPRTTASGGGNALIFRPVTVQ